MCMMCMLLFQLVNMSLIVFPGNEDATVYLGHLIHEVIVKSLL